MTTRPSGGRYFDVISSVLEEGVVKIFAAEVVERL